MIRYEWVENDPAYVNGYIYARLPSGVNIFGIRREWVSGLINRTYRWCAISPLRNPNAGRPVGGFYPSLEEAKASADEMISAIFEDACHE